MSAGFDELGVECGKQSLERPTGGMLSGSKQKFGVSEVHEPWHPRGSKSATGPTTKTRRLPR
jgi:hypothetical protein